MREVILFVLSFVLLLIIYELFIVRRAKVRKTRKGKEKKAVEPMEVTYLVKRYHLDLEKINYSRLLHTVAIVSSFDIALTASIVLFIKNFYLELLVGFFCMIIIILISYHIVYLLYKKGGMVKDGSQKNRE